MSKKLVLSSLITLGIMLLLVPAAFAADAHAQQVELLTIEASKWRAIAAALAISVAAFGGALAQGRAAAAALEGIARNPGSSGQIFTPLILGLALIESLVIYALLIAFFIMP